MSTPDRFNRDTESAPTDDRDRLPEVIRSEEELVVTRESVEGGRVRLVKHIVTETVTKTVEVRREVLHVERLTGDDGDRRVDDAATTTAEPERSHASRLPERLRGGFDALQRRARPPSAAQSPVGASFVEGEMEIVLMEEEVVVTKRIVPRERVRLRRETVVEQRQIEDTLRKEQVDLVEEPVRLNTKREDR